MMPPTLEHYIHRVGRTARAGRSGISVSLAGEYERKIVKEVIKNATTPVKNRIIPQGNVNVPSLSQALPNHLCFNIQLTNAIHSFRNNK